MSKKTVFTAVTGRPNVGKSTLLNVLLGEKISIISKKPQTTRNKITGILTKEETQYVFFDTPGIHIPKSLLGKYMAKSASNAITDVDVIVLIIEPVAKITPAEREIIEKAKSGNIPVILVINKIDTIKKENILEIIGIYSSEYKFSAIIPISALKEEGVDLVIEEIDKYLSESEFFFPEDMITDQPEKQIAAEFIREKALRLLDKEIPHGIGVVIEEFNESENKKLINIRAEIYCEKESHKKIIIGKNGEMIKKIGSYARGDLEKFFGSAVYLDLWVKIKNNWRDKADMLINFGYNEKDL